MKAPFYSLALLALLAFFFAPGIARAQDDPGDQGVSFQTFYDQLGDQGTWVQTDNYGYVFQPNVQDPNWAPYTQGHWVDTDQGWTWVSDESWGWATYHYGRWVNIDGTGWVWVPGYRWAPAWVSWRYGGGYCGWAPLPPETMIGAEFDDRGGQGEIGFHFGDDVDVSFHIGPGCYNFVHVEDMGEPNYRGRFVERGNNYAIINKTTNITNINVNKTVVINNGAANNFQSVNAGGPSLAKVNANSRQHVQSVKLTQAGQPGQSSVQGNSLAVYAPRVNPAAAQTAKPARVAQTISHPTFNRGDSIAKPLDVTASVKAPKPTTEAIQAARKAQANAPAAAKIAKEKTPVNTTLSKPQTSAEPVAPAPPKKTPEFSGANPANSNTVHPDEAQPNVTHNPANPPSTDEPKKTVVKPPPAEGNPQPEPTFHPQAQPQPEVRPEQQPKQEVHPQTQQEVRPQQQPKAKEEPRQEQQPKEEPRPQGPAGNSTNNVPGH